MHEHECKCKERKNVFGSDASFLHYNQCQCEIERCECMRDTLRRTGYNGCKKRD